MHGQSDLKDAHWTICCSNRNRSSHSGETKRLLPRKRNGVRPPFRFRWGLAGPQAFVLLGLRAKRNETGVFEGVTGKALRLAPPNTVLNRKDPLNINGLRVTPNRPETFGGRSTAHQVSLFQTVCHRRSQLPFAHSNFEHIGFSHCWRQRKTLSSVTSKMFPFAVFS